MSEEDFEIEYLDEDEDVVQQCVQAPVVDTPAPPAALYNVPVPSRFAKPDSDNSSSSLLVERPISRSQPKRKKKREEEDSDYDPNDDYEYEPGPRRTRRKIPTSTPKNIPTVDIRKPKQTIMTEKEELKFRKDMGVKIPNFEDPLCLPVKAIMKEEGEVRKLRNWNKLCLNTFKNYDVTLKPDVGETVSSQRAVVLRNVKNKLTGKMETTIWSKQTAQSAKDKKSEVFQCVLPKYREAKLLDFPITTLTKRAKTVRNVETVILAKEDDKEDTMVVYKPQHALSAVYKLVEEEREEAADKINEEKRQVLQELTVCRICAPCYQSSWRGFKKTAKKKSVVCPICIRTFVSVYNLLAHVKTHSAAEVHSNKELLCKTLAGVVEYHYRCRICQEKCGSIKELRKHVLTHQSTEKYQCEVCNRVNKPTLSLYV